MNFAIGLIGLISLCILARYIMLMFKRIHLQIEYLDKKCIELDEPRGPKTP